VLGQPGKAVYVTAAPTTADTSETPDLARQFHELSTSLHAAIRDLNERVATLESKLRAAEH
jgi:hypothetical protein